MAYEPHPPWRIEEEREWQKTAEYFPIKELSSERYRQEPHHFTSSIWVIMDGKNRVIATVGDRRDAELIVDQVNSLFEHIKQMNA